MLDEAVRRKVIALIAEEACVAPADVTPDKLLTVDLAFDSLAYVELVMAIEDEFDITIPDDVANTVKSVRDALEAVDKALSSAPAAPA